MKQRKPTRKLLLTTTTMPSSASFQPMMEDDYGEAAQFELDHGCAVLFDLFHACSSVKGRFRDYYRFGKVRSCMPYWNDFFLCMRLKLEPDEKRAQERWLLQRQKSIQLRFNDTQLTGESPTVGVIWQKHVIEQSENVNEHQ